MVHIHLNRLKILKLIILYAFTIVTYVIRMVIYDLCSILPPDIFNSVVVLSLFKVYKSTFRLGIFKLAFAEATHGFELWLLSIHFFQISCPALTALRYL